MPQTERLRPDQLKRAAQILHAGGRVAFATETVYGLGANALDNRAVARIYAAKERPSFNPLIVHVASLDAAQTIATFSQEALQLASAFWPGPLTLVLPLKPLAKIAPLVTAGLDSIAIRVPGHRLALDLLHETGLPIAAPSANPSGKISPTTMDHVLAGLDEKIEAVLDGGPCAVGLESTIIGVTGAPTLLRPGGQSTESIEAVLRAPLGGYAGAINAPGQMVSHYAPDANLRLNVTQPEPHESYLGFGPGTATFNLSVSGDLLEAAANLFGHLHSLDQIGKPIAVAPIPHSGLGRAINDRLTRAAAPKS